MMKIFFIFLFALVGFCLSHILKLPECQNYNAVFSKVKHDYRLLGEILASIGGILLPQCLSRCMIHPNCISVNYRRDNSHCELLGVAAQLFDRLRNSSFVTSPGWLHLETDYTIKKVY